WGSSSITSTASSRRSIRRGSPVSRSSHEPGVDLDPLVHGGRRVDRTGAPATLAGDGHGDRAFRVVDDRGLLPAGSQPERLAAARWPGKSGAAADEPDL